MPRGKPPPFQKIVKAPVVVWLYVEGVRLQNAADAATLKIADKELPSFDASVHELLYSTLALHSSFILATADGTALLLAEERYQRHPQEEQEWPAPGSEDTELGVLMELEVRHGEASVYAGVQA